MTTPYRQPIRPGDQGLDVLAVGRVLKKRGHQITPSRSADSTFVEALKNVEKNHKLTIDGVYGPQLHAILANGSDGLPCFDAYGRWLYTHATLRAWYVNPFRLAPSLTAGRIDQGVDYHGVGPIVAIGHAVVKGLGGSGWPGGHFLSYQLLDGPHAGRYVYVAEAIEYSASKGEKVGAGQQVAIFGPGAQTGFYPGIEIGWGSPTLNLTWHRYAFGRYDGLSETESGLAFARLLKAAGTPLVHDPGPGPEFPIAV